MAGLTAGKIRGLQQVANEGGTFTVLAMDHRGSFKQMVNPKDPDSISYAEVVRRKIELCKYVAPYASAVLLDPIYGAAQCISAGALPGGKGLLVSIEESGYEGGKENRVTRLLTDWGVEKIKRLGASAVKILVYYRPDLKDLAKKQLATVNAVAEECLKFDIPLFVEPVSYPVGNEVGKPEEFARRKEEIVIETARQITALPIDVLKAEFPADLSYRKDERDLARLCQELDKASRVPWVLLSAGVNIETFSMQVEIACEAGASGFLGGRAIWQEVMPITDPQKRVEFLTTTVAERMKRLNRIVSEDGKAWWRKFGVSLEDVSAAVSEEWYRKY